MKVPRWLHRSWALVAGYFWSPCPECGQMFGGHERQPQIPFTVYGEGSLMLCPRCAPVVSAREYEAFQARWQAPIVADNGMSDEQVQAASEYWGLSPDYIRAMPKHAPDCALVTTHHLTCTCGAYVRVREVSGG